MSPSAGSPIDIDLYAVTSTWTESGVTWNTQPSIAGSFTATRQISAVNQFVEPVSQAHREGLKLIARCSSGWSLSVDRLPVGAGRLSSSSTPRARIAAVLRISSWPVHVWRIT